MNNNKEEKDETPAAVAAAAPTLIPSPCMNEEDHETKSSTGIARVPESAAAAATVAATALDDDESPRTSLSKKQQRKKRRYEQALRIKAQRKMHEREVKHAKAMAQGRDLDREKRQMEANRLRNELNYGIAYSIRGLKTLQQKLKEAQSSSFQVCFDCSFENMMTDKEINSLASQIRYCYSANKKSPNPVLFTLSSLSSTGKIWQNLIKVSGFPDSWIPRGFSYSSKSFLEMVDNESTLPTTAATTTTSEACLVVSKDAGNGISTMTTPTITSTTILDTSKFVYLTSDSENVLQQLDNSKIYIIGGIVDRNRLKGVTFEKAQRLGIQTAKLPISQYLNLFTTKVLVCNHVFEILLKCKENGYDWKKAMLDVLPARKDAQEG